MQKVLQWKGSIREYQTGFKNLQLEKPEKCRCGCVKFHKWGKYERYVVEKDTDYTVPIQRIRCIKCHMTYSYLPSFCISKFCYSADFIMTILSALILKIRFEFGDMKRQAYAVLRRFVRLESLWMIFLRARGFGDFPGAGKERTMKIFTALLKFHKNLISSFFKETGRHFMSLK